MEHKRIISLLKMLKKLAGGPRQQAPMESMEGLACVWDGVECTDYTRIRDSTGKILEERLSIFFEDGSEILVFFLEGTYSWESYPAIPTAELNADII